MRRRGGKASVSEGILIINHASISDRGFGAQGRDGCGLGDFGDSEGDAF